LEEAAQQLGIPAKILRAIEWDRRDLLGDAADADRIERRYAAFLGLEAAPPTDVETVEPLPSRRSARSYGWVVLLVGLVPLLVIAFGYALQAGADEDNPPRQLPRVDASVDASQASEDPTDDGQPGVPPRQRRANLVITAELGGSWVEAHSGSQTGPLLYRGTLTPGRRLRLDARERIWVRLGAASNLSLTVNGRPPPIELEGTLDVLVTAQGIRPA
jgi:hypothetical protein